MRKLLRRRSDSPNPNCRPRGDASMTLKATFSLLLFNEKLLALNTCLECQGPWLLALTLSAKLCNGAKIPPTKSSREQAP